jgi:hypothetical protein
MSDNDEKNEAQRGAQRSAASHRESPDRIPKRDTAPAGTPAQKYPSASHLRALSEPEPLPPQPAARPASERPPGVDTISPPRTVGGQTARLKVQEPEDGRTARSRDRKAAEPVKIRSAADDGEEVVAPPAKAAAQGGDRTAAKAVARGAKEGRASWEADVKISEPDLAVQKGHASAPAGEAVTPGGPVESRWPIAIAVGAIAFALGSLLPLPFRKQIVGSAGDAAGAAGSPTSPTAPARIPLPPHAPQPRSPTGNAQPPAALTAAPAPALPGTQTERPDLPGMTAPPFSTAAPSTSASGGKSPGKNGKPGRIGDIF